MDMLKGSSVLVTGVITKASIGYHVARVAHEQGANVILTGYGRLSLVERLAHRLSPSMPVVELDVTRADHLESLAERVGEHTDRLDGVVHSVAYAPSATLGPNFLTATWPDVATAMHVSAYSLKALTMAALPLMGDRGSVVGLDFDASVAWPGYGWMGVAKAGLESCARYLARDLGPRGIRVNLVAAGPLKTLASRRIPDGPDGPDPDEAARFEAGWGRRAPLGWDPGDQDAVARTCVALLSDWLPVTTGAIVHADGGAHAVGCLPGEARA